MTEYDAVVVGAGNSGLTAALRLVNSCKKTLLIEKNNSAGGCATSFVRGRFEFEVSLHESSGVTKDEENAGSLMRIFNENDIDIDWIALKDCFRCISQWSDGSGVMDVTMPAGTEAFKAKMAQYCPESADVIEVFFDLMEETMDGIHELGSMKDPAAFMQQYPNFCRIGDQSFNRVMDELNMPAKARDILSCYWPYLGVDLDHMSWTHYIAMLHKYITLKPAIPQKTSHEISTMMLERFRQKGGDIWMNCTAQEFITEDGVCKGVKTNRGDIRADIVIANINPHIVYGKMVPDNLVPEREKKLAGTRTLSGRPLVASFGLNTTAEALGINDYSIFFLGTADSIKEYNTLFNFEGNDCTLMLCYNIENPDFSPEGTCVISFTTMYNGDLWGDVEIEDYSQVKTAAAKHCIDILKDKTGIDVSPYIEEVSVSTPWTTARYLGTPEGAVYGYESNDWDGIIARSMTLSNEFPVPGLWTVGAAGPQGDGFSSAYTTGDIVAGMALKATAAQK